jgi:hypothetical protein
MAKLLAGRFNRFTEKLFATKEGQSSLNSISPEIQMQYSFLAGVEDRYPQGWSRFSQSFNVAAVAAQFGVVQLRNPTGSSLLIVIESLWVTTAPNFQIALKAVSTDQATVFTGASRMDARQSPGPSGITSQGTQVANPNVNQLANANFSQASGASLQVITNQDQQWTVLPGDALFTWNTAVNAVHSITIGWRERVLESSELS